GEERGVVFGLHPADDRRAEHGRLVVGEPGPARREHRQRRPEVAQVGQRRGALVAPFHVRADRDLLADRQLLVVIRLEESPGGVAAERRHAILVSGRTSDPRAPLPRTSRSWFRRAWRARVSRDLTVPTATPSE